MHVCVCVFWQRAEGVLSVCRRDRPHPSSAGVISNILVMGILVEQLLPVLPPATLSMP